MRLTGALAAVSTAFVAKLMRWRSQPDPNRRALAALDDGQLHNLSELGQQVRREERRIHGRLPVK